MKARAWSFRLAAGGVVGALSMSAMARDEDARKLKDQLPAVVMSPITGQAIPAGLFPSGVDYPPYDAWNVTLQSWLPLNELPGWDPNRDNTAADLWGYTSPSGREYVAIGVRRGTAFVEVTNPLQPTVVGFVQGAESLWHDVCIVGHYAYVGSEHGRGVQVIDLAQIDSGVVRWVRDVTASGHRTTHTLLSGEDPRYIYACGANVANGGVAIIDLIDPENPAIVGGFTGHYVHEAQIVVWPHGPYAGRTIAFCCGGLNTGWSETRLSIVDVTDPNNVTLIGECRWAGAGYSHQGWLSNDRTLFYLNDELDEYYGNVPTTTTRVIDISNLAQPFQTGTFSNGLTAIDHNEYVQGNLLFQSNYRSGLRVWDLRQSATSPREIAHFDTYPNDNNASFNGNWGNYPYFASSLVAMSDMEHGLILLKVNCYADCDTSTGQGVLDIFDFLCFQNLFAAADPRADCDRSTGQGVLDVFDFLCFQNEFAFGCP